MSFSASPEQPARIFKAITLADLLDAADITATMAADMTPTDWQRAAFAAGVRKPSPATCALVQDMLRSRAQARAVMAPRPAPEAIGHSL